MRSADIRYLGQSYELNVPLEDEVDDETGGRLVRDFHSKHHQVYGQSSTEAPLEFVNLRTVHWYPLQKPEVLRPKGGGSWADAQKDSRRAYFFPDHAEGIEMPVYDRLRLPVDLEQKGPLVVEQRDTTTVVYPGQSCRMDPAGNIILTNPLKKR